MITNVLRWVRSSQDVPYSLTVAGAIGLLLGAGYVWLGTEYMTRSLLVGPRWQIWVGLACAWLATALLFSMIGHVESRHSSNKNWLADCGVLVLLVLAVAGGYALAFTSTGILYGYSDDMLGRVGKTVMTAPRDALSKDYFECLYFSITTLTTTGYGDFRPPQNARALANIEALNGYLVLGSIASYLFARLSIRPASSKSPVV